MLQKSYATLDLLVDTHSDQYRVRVLESPVGEASHLFHLAISPESLQQFWAEVGRTTAPQEGNFQAEVFGHELFTALFGGDIESILRRSLDYVRTDDANLRIRLRLEDVPELADLPWELLYDRERSRFLLLSQRVQLVRYLPLSEPPPPLHVELPLHILSVIAEVPGLPTLDQAAERARLQEGLAPLLEDDLVTLHSLAKPTLSALQRHLRRHPTHVLHFVGHGYWDAEGAESGLVLTDNHGEALLVDGRQLGLLLADHQPLRLVLLNACDTGRVLESQDLLQPYPDVARHLIHQGIPAVIAMQHAISDTAAIDFSSQFYAALADGYALDAALAEGRKAISLAGNELEWATPVLYTRSPESRIFQIGADAPSESEESSTQGGVNINIANQGGKIENSQITFGDVKG